MMSITCILLFAALNATIINMINGKCPLSVPMLLTIIAGLLACLPR